MKPKAHLRIVCLKNTYSTKSYQNHQSFSVQNNSKLNNQSQSNVVPNLVYLSARLQEAEKNNQSSRLRSTYKKLQQVSLEVSSGLRNGKEISLRQIDEKQLTIQKYFQKKREQNQKQKMTIRNMTGSIDFSSAKNKQRKIQKRIKQTLQKDQVHKRLHRKRNHQEQIIKNSANRVFLEEDFRNFLNNKEIQYKNPKIIDLKQEENRKLHKLTIVNPEKQSLRQLKDNSKSLNLFNFLSNNNQNKIKSPSKQVSPIRLDPVNSKKRLQKKVMKLALNLKTQQYDFGWKKLQADKAFDLTSINS